MAHKAKDCNYYCIQTPDTRCTVEKTRPYLGHKEKRTLPPPRGLE